MPRSGRQPRGIARGERARRLEPRCWSGNSTGDVDELVTAVEAGEREREVGRPEATGFDGALPPGLEQLARQRPGRGLVAGSTVCPRRKRQRRIERLRVADLPAERNVPLGIF